MGSLGSIIARQLAEQLQYRLVWRDIINQAAIKAGAPEAALAILDELNLLGLTLTPEVLQAYTAAVKSVMEELASQGRIVIVGRAGQMVLAHHPNVLHVRIIAPFELRAARIAERQNILLASARKQVEASDRNRRIFIKRAYAMNLADPVFYDLIINTRVITPEIACKLIRQALPAESQAAPPV